MTKHIKHLLRPFMHSSTTWKHQLFSRWDSIMGSLAAHTTIEKMYKDTIILGVYDSCWLQELYLLSPTLLKTINENLDHSPLKQIRFKQVSKKKQVQQAKPIEKKIVPVSLTQTEEKVLASITDEAMRVALKAFLIRCHTEREK